MMTDKEIEAGKEFINAMQYGVIEKLTKQGNALIFNYFKQLETREKTAIDYIEDRIDILQIKVKDKTTDKYYEGKLIGEIRSLKDVLNIYKGENND